MTAPAALACARIIALSVVGQPMPSFPLDFSRVRSPSTPVATASTESVNKHWTEKLTAICTAASSLLTPLSILIVGVLIQTSLKRREINAKMVELAVGVLEKQPEDEDPLRVWAVKTMDLYSEAPFPTEYARQHPVVTTSVQSGAWRDTTPAYIAYIIWRDRASTQIEEFETSHQSLQAIGQVLLDRWTRAKSASGMLAFIMGYHGQLSERIWRSAEKWAVDQPDFDDADSGIELNTQVAMVPDVGGVGHILGMSGKQVYWDFVESNVPRCCMQEGIGVSVSDPSIGLDRALIDTARRRFKPMESPHNTNWLVFSQNRREGHGV